MYVYPTAAMDPYDSAEEETQWILGHNAESDIQNEPADHEELDEGAAMEELMDVPGRRIEPTSGVSLPPVPPFTPYEHNQPEHRRKVTLPPEFTEDEGSAGIWSSLRQIKLDC